MRIYLALGGQHLDRRLHRRARWGAPSQLARKLGVELVDLTCDGNTTDGMLADVARAPAAADVVTLTAGGTDLLGGALPRATTRAMATRTWAGTSWAFRG